MKKLIIIALAIVVSCSPQKTEESDTGKIKVVATTGMLYDAVIQIAGDQVDASYIMGPGVDPHLYKATQGDLRKFDDADLIIYNGLTLEGKMGEILEKLSKRKSVSAAAENISKTRLLSAVGYENTYDPHIWFDVKLWKLAVAEIEIALSEADSANATLYKSNAVQFIKKLDSLNTWVSNEIKSIPLDQRILITAHDAFQYFGKAYGIRVVGLQGLSTVTEPGLRDVARTIDIIIENNIKSIFIETSVSERTINAVVQGCKEKGHEVSIGGALYSDAMGEIGTSEGTYMGMIRSNVETIVNGLK